MNMEIVEDVLYIVRAIQPVMLELIGDMSRFEGIWGSFEEYRYDNLQQLFTIPKDNSHYLVVLDGGCDSQEMENIMIWHTFRERGKFGQGFLVSHEKEPERYRELKAKWKLSSDCSVLFVNRINEITLDKFKPEYDFVGKFTLDDYGRKLMGKHAKPYLVSQLFSEIEGEEDYRLVGNNIESTWQELNSDCAILFFNRNHSEIDDFFKNLKTLANGNCEGEDCGEYFSLIEKVRNHGLQLFSLNISFNDIPSFVLDHAPTVLIFKQGKENPEEIKGKTVNEFVQKLSGYLIKQEMMQDEEF